MFLDTRVGLDGLGHVVGGVADVRVPRAQGFEQRGTQTRDAVPERGEAFEMAVGHAAEEVGAQIRREAVVGRGDVAGYVEVEAVPLHLREIDEPGIPRPVLPPLVGGDHAIHVHLAHHALAVLLAEMAACVDEHQRSASPFAPARLAQEDDAGGDARAVEDVGRQPHHPQEHAVAEHALANRPLGPAPEQNAVGEHHGGSPPGPQGGDDVLQEGEVGVLLRRTPVDKAPVRILVGHVHPLLGEGGVADRRVVLGDLPALQAGGGEGVALVDLRRHVAVDDHVHPRQGGGDTVALLPVYGRRKPGGKPPAQSQAVDGLLAGAQERRTRAAGGVVNGLPGPFQGTQAAQARQGDGHAGRGVELPLAFARIDGELAHHVLVDVTEQVGRLGAVARREIHASEQRYQAADLVANLPRTAELRRAVVVNPQDLPEIMRGVCLQERLQPLVEHVSHALRPAEFHQIGVARARGKPNLAVVLRVRQGHGAHEDQGQDVVLVLRRVHAAPHLVGGLPAAPKQSLARNSHEDTPLEEGRSIRLSRAPARAVVRSPTVLEKSPHRSRASEPLRPRGRGADPG